MDTRLLQHFLALVEHGNFARAADAAHLSQPAFSRAIQQLEQQLGVTLFDRGRHGARPTAFAEAALPHARAVLGALDALHQEMAGMQGLERGRLAIGTGPYPAVGLIDRLCAQFVDRYPGIHLRLHTGNWHELRDRLLGGELELFVADTRELAGEDRLAIRDLPRRGGHVFCRRGHPLCSVDNLQWHDLAAYPLAMTRVPDHIEKRIQQLAGDSQQRRIECDSVALLVAIVAQSNAISLAPDAAIARELDAGRLVTLPMAAPSGLETGYGLVTRRGHTLSPAARAFLELLEAETVDAP